MLRAGLPMQGGMGSRIAAVALAAVALAAVAAAPADASRGMEIGLQDDSHFLDEDAAVRGAAFGHARSLRTSSLRANVLWASVVSDPAAKTAPAVVTFDFSRFDRLVEEAAARGMRVQLDAGGRRAGVGDARPQDLGDHPDPERYAEFAAAAASHFNGRVRALSIPERAELARAAEARAAVREGVQEGQGQGHAQAGAPPGARVREDLRRGLPGALPGRVRRDQAGRAGRAGLDRQPTRT